MSVAFFGDHDMAIENIGVFNDCDEENESNDVLYTVKEEILETGNDNEICEQVFPIKSEVKLEAIDDLVPSEVDYQISYEGYECQNSEGYQMPETSQVSQIRQTKKKFKFEI